MTLQLEDALDDLHLGSCGLKTAEGDPVVDDKAGPDDVWASVNGSGAERDLKEVAELIKLFDGGLRVYESAVVADNAVSAYKEIVGDWISEDLDAKSVSDDLFGFLVEVRVDEGHVVVAGDAVA